MTLKLRGKAKTFEIDKEYERSFEELKSIMTTDTLLAYPGIEKPFVLTTDASNVEVNLNEMRNYFFDNKIIRDR